MALVGQLPLANFIKVVLYRADVLAEDDDRSGDYDWEVVAVLCQADDEEPMNTATLMANHFGADGGTRTNMSPEQFEAALRTSYNYWKSRSMGITRYEYAQQQGLPERFVRIEVNELPEKVDLRHLCGPAQDQGELSSSTAFAVAAAFQGCPTFSFTEPITEDKSPE